MRVNRTNAILLAAGAGAACIAGLAIHGPVGGVLLLAVALFLVTLSRQAWGVVRREGRPVRVVVVALLVIVAALKLAGRI